MQHLIATYGYAAIFLLMLLESACIPVPSELIMTFGGALAAGAVPGTTLNLAGVIIAGVAGNVAGSYVAWAAGRYGGQAALRRWGQRLHVREHELDRASQWFDRYGPRAVLIGRLLPVIRTFISLPAGIADMDPVRFGIYTTIGCIPWTAALAYAGYAVGANWESIVNAFKGPTYIIAAVVVIALAIAVWRYLRAPPGRARRGRHAPAAPGHAPLIPSAALVLAGSCPRCPATGQGGGFRGPPAGQLVGALILRMARMALDPEPLHRVRAGRGVQPGPQVGVLDRFLVRRLPAVTFPGGEPPGDAVAQVHAVGVDVHDGRPGQALQPPDRRHDLHAVVRGHGLPAVDLLLVAAVPQDGAPPARARVG